MKFSGKTIIITGATGGMGKEIVKKLSSKDCEILLLARKEDKLKDLCQKVSKDKCECFYQICDVKEKKDVKKAVDFAHKKFKKIDVLIQTAGILVPNPIETFDATIIKNSIDINFMGMVYFIEEVLPIMKKQKSGMIAVTSTLPDKRGLAGWGAYGASKAALSWLMESLRAEASMKYNIKLITIKPGSVETPMIADYERKGSISAERAASIIIHGLEKEKKVIQFPFFQVVAQRLFDLFPTFAYDMQPLESLKGEGFPDPEVDE